MLNYNYIMRLSSVQTCAVFGSNTAVLLVALAVGFEAVAIDEAGMQLDVLDMTDVFMAVAPVEITAEALELAIQDDIVVAANELIVIFSFLAEVAEVAL